MSRISRVRTRARRKIIAVAAAGGVLLAGATVTSLAAWLDEEWVVAGVDGDAGVGASSFEIEQRVASDAGSWFNRETEGAAGVVDFDDIAASLSPGTSAFGWVSLRAAVDSVNGTLTVDSDYVDGDSPLGDVLTYGARVVANEASCTVGGYAAGTVLVADGTTLETGSGATSFGLVGGDPGDPGAAKTVCFRIAFPSGTTFDALQGETAALGWHFEALSD
jgi:hypothetical protein